MDVGQTFESTKRGRNPSFRLAGISAAIVLLAAVVPALVGSAGAAIARVAAVPSNTSAPAITGTVQQGQTLTAEKGAWSGTEPITYTYEWWRCNNAGAHCRTITGTTGSTYFVQADDVGNTLRLTVTARNAEGANSVTSSATASVVRFTAVAPANTASPTISGSTVEGQTLTPDKGTWSGTEPITYSWAWQWCDSAGGHCSYIPGAVTMEYKLEKVDIDKTLRVVVTARNSAGTASATSAATALVKAAVPPAVSLSSSTLEVVYNKPALTLSGVISTRQPGQTVTIQQQRFAFADTSFTPLATVQTGTDGVWSLTTSPTAQTAYQAGWNGVLSPIVTVGVRPLVTFHVISGNRFSTTVVAGRSFAGQLVQFQRRSSFGQWVTIKRVRVGETSNAIFGATLPKGTSVLRIAISVNQAGAGYLGGLSRTIVYHQS